MLGVLGALVAWQVAALPFEPVNRARVQKFALRQHLEVTATNADQVLRYLATTRRWRGSGLVVSVVLFCAWSVTTGHGLNISSTAAFAGWFVGAVIAEWRVSMQRDASTRAAVLAPRTWHAYIDRSSGVFAVTCGVALAIGCVSAGLHAVSGGREEFVAVAGWALLAVAITTVLALAARRVIGRPQPAALPDVIAADDAVRSRSLHVLAGSGIAVAGYLSIGLLNTVVEANYVHVSEPTWYLLAGLATGLVLPVVGFLVATMPFRAREQPQRARTHAVRA